MASSAVPSPQVAETPAVAQEYPSPTSSQKRPQLKSSVGFSWKNLRQSGQPNKMHIIPGTLDEQARQVLSAEEQQHFSQQELELQWMSMCNRMPQRLSGIATRMKNMNPVITEYPQVEVVVDNQLALDQMNDIRKSILKTLKIYLHNQDITLSMRLAERQEHVRILSRKEQYELMEKENPAIAKLRELLNLELA